MMSLEELSKAKWVTKGQLFEKILELEKLLFSTVVMFSSDRRLLGRLWDQQWPELSRGVWKVS